LSTLTIKPLLKDYVCLCKLFLRLLKQPTSSHFATLPLKNILPGVFQEASVVKGFWVRGLDSSSDSVRAAEPELENVDGASHHGGSIGPFSEVSKDSHKIQIKKLKTRIQNISSCIARIHRFQASIPHHSSEYNKIEMFDGWMDVSEIFSRLVETTD
jgi:hypothetical protein